MIHKIANGLVGIPAKTCLIPVNTATIEVGREGRVRERGRKGGGWKEGDRARECAREQERERESESERQRARDR